MVDEADCSVILAHLDFLGKCDDQWLSPGGGHSPVCQILLQIVSVVIKASPPA